MTTTLIVLAHPESRSFNGAWARATAGAAQARGDRVLWSDLCAMGFDPAEGPAHYPGAAAPFDVMKTQAKAAAAGTLPVEVAGEVEKLRAADRIVFHFPLWWFAPPAMLKGWCERVLVNGGSHDTGRRFDTGLLRGTRGTVRVTTGSTPNESAFDGREGDVRMLLGRSPTPCATSASRCSSPRSSMAFTATTRARRRRRWTRGSARC